MIPASPDAPLVCLLVQPLFSASSFWNYVEGCRHIGAKTPSPPLGLLTVAALLPQQWKMSLMDLNCVAFDEKAWRAADVICVGGMLPQQKGILEIIRRAKADGKYVVVGGADPSSQPQTYDEADALVLGEGESAIPVWLVAWRAGQPRGVFKETEKPDVSQSPVPRFDLLNFWNYAQVGLQYSRSYPFNCEFCDIIELFGRKPRSKTPEQLLRELDRLKELGYSGFVDLVDDNFIGNKRDIKRHLLPALTAWNERNGHPFFYITEASMNVADDDDLLAALQKADFRFIFMGIETPDPDLLLKTQKSQNTMRPIVERVHRLYKYGLVATGGFIIGLDGEKKGMDQQIIDLVEDTCINMAMIGMLVALPNTQLTRRLAREGRLMNFKGELVQDENGLNAEMATASVEVVDQTLAGLNFVTTRDRVEIMREYLNVVSKLYAPRSYFDRVLKVAKLLKAESKHKPRLFERVRNVRGLINVCWAMSLKADTRWLFWRNFYFAARKNVVVLEHVLRLSGIYVHFRNQVAYVSKVLERQIADQEKVAPELRTLARSLQLPPQATKDPSHVEPVPKAL